MSKNFLNYHILISHSPSCLNRDDMNMQKTAIFGGKRRVRISSQSLKRVMRKSPYFSKKLGLPSKRTRELKSFFDLLIQELGKKFPSELIEKAISFMSDKREFSEKDIYADAVAPWCIEEIEWLCRGLESNDKLNEQCEKFIAIKGNGANDKKKKRSIVQATYKEIEKQDQLCGLIRALENAPDIALFGRMAASGLMRPMEGSLAVAHSITTHAVESDIDWFTAVDDLQELGSGHLDTQEFSSGVFYRYASLNIDQLRKNLGDVDRQRSLEIGAHVLRLLATEVPSAKQQSFAAHNLADLAMASFSDQPISLANAFEAPVRSKGEGLLKPSIVALHDYWQRIYCGYGFDDHCAEFALQMLEIPDKIVYKDKLSDLEAWIRNDGEAKK